jgi:hypothetical protein
MLGVVRLVRSAVETYFISYAAREWARSTDAGVPFRMFSTAGRLVNAFSEERYSAAFAKRSSSMHDDGPSFAHGHSVAGTRSRLSKRSPLQTTKPACKAPP